jgi:hypothetical protein
MISVLGIHGIAQQQVGRHQLLGQWTLALADGIERAVGRRGPPQHSLDLAFYGDLFLGPADGKGPGVGDLSDQDVAFLAAIEREVVDEEVASQEKMGLKRVPERLGRLTAWLDDRFGVASHLLFIGDLVQVRRFQQERTLHESVLDRVREALAAASPRVLIGHSLGSVVALEAVCTIEHHGVDTLVTLGSPLGLRSIQNGLSQATVERRPGLPPGVRRWVNVYDPGDPVTCAGGLARAWQEVSDQEVDNGDDPHRVERYLGKKATGAAVLAGASGA